MIDRMIERESIYLRRKRMWSRYENVATLRYLSTSTNSFASAGKYVEQAFHKQAITSPPMEAP